MPVSDRHHALAASRSCRQKLSGSVIGPTPRGNKRKVGSDEYDSWSVECHGEAESGIRAAFHHEVHEVQRSGGESDDAS